MHKIEKGRELGKPDPLGVRLVPFGETVQECEHVFRGDLINGTITEFLDESFNDGLVGSYQERLDLLNEDPEK